MSVTLRLPTIPTLFDAPEVEEAEGAYSARWGQSWFCSSPENAIGNAIIAPFPRIAGRLR